MPCLLARGASIWRARPSQHLWPGSSAQRGCCVRLLTWGWVWTLQDSLALGVIFAATDSVAVLQVHRSPGYRQIFATFCEHHSCVLASALAMTSGFKLLRCSWEEAFLLGRTCVNTWRRQQGRGAERACAGAAAGPRAAAVLAGVRGGRHQRRDRCGAAARRAGAGPHNAAWHARSAMRNNATAMRNSGITVTCRMSRLSAFVGFLGTLLNHLLWLHHGGTCASAVSALMIMCTARIGCPSMLSMVKQACLVLNGFLFTYAPRGEQPSTCCPADVPSLHAHHRTNW